MESRFCCVADDALRLLKDGNIKYLTAQTSEGDISLQRRVKTFTDGQKPYAVVVSCSDSRVLPESIFSAGIGELFVVRVVGNVVDDCVLASVEYAVSNLGAPLVVILGHTGCGAVSSAINNNASGRIVPIIHNIQAAICDEKDDCKASLLNVTAGVDKVKQAFQTCYANIKIVGAMYFADTGKVEFLQ